jgi:hypothetical protein
MKKTAALQQNLFDVPASLAGTKLPRNLQTAPLKPLVQALLTELLAAQRVAPAVPGLKG